MLDYGSLRNIFKESDNIQSQNLILAEWNMNKYKSIEAYGIYTNNAPFTTSYSADDPNISSGDNYLIFDDGTIEIPESQEYFSDLASCFQPQRPDPGIVLLQKFNGALIVPDCASLKTDRLNPTNPRFYPVTDSRPYDYFNSAKNIVKNPLKDPKLYAWYDNDWFFYEGDLEKLPGYTPPEGVISKPPWQIINSYYVHNNSVASFPPPTQVYNGISNPTTGKISAASPFVVYEEEFPCNKIVIKVQNHAAVPDDFQIDVLVGSTWVPAYTKAQSSSSDFATGILVLYYNSGAWIKPAAGVDPDTYVLNDLSQLSEANPTELKKIRGVRMTVESLSTIPNPNPSEQAQFNTRQGSLELIEISPRLEADVTDYTESLSLNSSLGDTTNFGLPVGSLVAGTGNIILSNEEEQFLFSSTLNDLNMLSPDTIFKFYQLVNSGGTNFAVPLKVMYSNNWTIQGDFSVSVDLEDGMKFLREKSAPDLLFQSATGIRLSAIILFLLDNSGVTGYEFKKSVNGRPALDEDVRIRTFFCKKEQTVAEVLEQLAIATQCSMYYDASGNLNVLTKERLTGGVSLEASTSTTPGTDFWFVLDEDYSYNGSPAAEYNYINGYKSNVESYSEEKINPMTDGDITYHSYGPRKVPGVDELPENVLKNLTEDFPPAALSFSNYTYGTRILWQPADDNESVLGAANVLRNVGAKNLKDIFTASYTAFDENGAVRQIYDEAKEDNEKLRNLVIYLDRNEGYTFPAFEGYILIDSEYIQYRGKLFSINGKEKVLFSEEELKQEIIDIPPGSSISFIGLIVGINFNLAGKDEDKYVYTVVKDGRGKFRSKIAPHLGFTEESSDLQRGGTFKLLMGGSRAKPPPGEVTADVKYNFAERIAYKGARRELLGRIPVQTLQSYLGFLKLTGPKGPADEKDIIESLYSASPVGTVARQLKAINRKTDNAVPGDFDDYVFLEGERRIYGKVIPLPFIPNTISTRMRLFSPRRKHKSVQNMMQTNSSIAGIGFGLNSKNEGYFVEVESVGAGKDVVAEVQQTKNLRFYRITINEKGVYEPNLLFAGPVGAYTVSNVDVQVIKNSNTADPVFELTLKIVKYANGVRYRVYYGPHLIGTYVEAIESAINIDNPNMFVFVRNDSQAIYEYVAASARPRGRVDEDYFNSADELDNNIKSGIIPVNQQFMFKEGEIQYYFNDFARLAREVKVFDCRFELPAFSSILIDISKVNPQYYVRKYKPTAFGAKIVVGNSSSGPILLGDESNLPLYITGIGVEELSTGAVTVEDVFEKTEESKRRVYERDKNKAIYGPQTFNIDSQYIQSIRQARSLMRWILSQCGRQRLSFNMDIFPNPLLELGDKIKIYDKARGYNQDNEAFGVRTFTVSSISYSVSDSGPSMNVVLLEVGE